MNRLVDATAYDTDAANTGVWKTFVAPNLEEFRVCLKLGGVYNDAFGKKMLELTAKYRNNNIQMENIEPKVQRQIVAQATAETIVADWSAEDFGQPFSVADCAATLVAAPAFAKWVSDTTNTTSDFIKKEQERIAGN
ncbi:MAG TPA: hypothetical protein PK745_00035 [bacterium]|nr:hypothetical protein [bacterium]